MVRAVHFLRRPELHADLHDSTVRLDTEAQSFVTGLRLSVTTFAPTNVSAVHADASGRSSLMLSSAGAVEIDPELDCDWPFDRDTSMSSTQHT